MYPIPAPYRVSSLHVRIVGLWHMAVKRSMQSFAVVIGSHTDDTCKKRLQRPWLEVKTSLKKHATWRITNER
jgi:hypothetical protein